MGLELSGQIPTFFAKGDGIIKKKPFVFLLILSFVLAACAESTAPVPPSLPAQASQPQAVNPLDMLEQSISLQDGRLSFTLPEGYGTAWDIQIRGRTETDGMGLSVHYLEQENEQGSWQEGETYTVDISGEGYSELTMYISWAENGMEKEIDLLPFL